MATFAIKCPHCLRDNTSFTVVTSRPHFPFEKNSHGWKKVETFASCNACQRGICGTVLVNHPHVTVQLETTGLVIDSSDNVKIGEWFPNSPKADVPAHLPALVAQVFTEAEELRLAGFRGPSGNAYRRALEAALKDVAPNMNGTLFKRIERLAEEHRLTQHMSQFAHRIRTLGNEASHETPVVEHDEIDDLAIFTRLFLMYEFTLPGMLPKTDDPK
ncbi:DUF4145 domain-containing protein [Paraburkholderia tropica]|uniref:DUF4145 domain-containing protein n=1 Tax=Paraburkholderia tropica TaxID=92647 RepID=UPI002AB6A8BF|nr:DUF4145 domain-containing protein [Paraburkholderia tropica]